MAPIPGPPSLGWTVVSVGYRAGRCRLEGFIGSDDLMDTAGVAFARIG